VLRELDQLRNQSLVGLDRAERRGQVREGGPSFARHRVEVKALQRKDLGHHETLRMCSSSNCSG